MTDRKVKSLTEEEIFEQLFGHVIAGDNESLKELVTRALSAGINAGDLLYKGMMPGMDLIGDEFKQNKIFIPEVLLSARAMNDGLLLLEPHLTEKGRPQNRKVLIGTIHGDMHDIGKNLVAIMLKGAGFDVVDLGINVPVNSFIEQAAKLKAELICISSLLTTTMPGMKSVIDGLHEAGLREKVRVMVGGAPVGKRFADNIGADGYADTAVHAVDLAKSLFKEMPKSN